MPSDTFDCIAKAQGGSFVHVVRLISYHPTSNRRCLTSGGTSSSSLLAALVFSLNE